MLGGPVVQQHIVEFIRGSGVKTDGVLDSTSANGPWTWVVPMGVAQILVTGCGAGSGGTGGTNASLSGGGGGGGTGMSLMNFPVEVVQGTSLTVTVGAKGTGGTLTVAATAGGDTTISPVVTSVFSDAGTTFKLLGGGGGGAISTGTTGYSGLSGAKVRSGGAGGSTGVGGGNNPNDSFVLANVVVPSNIFFNAQGGAGGGGAGIWD